MLPVAFRAQALALALALVLVPALVLATAGDVVGPNDFPLRFLKVQGFMTAPAPCEGPTDSTIYYPVDTCIAYSNVTSQRWTLNGTSAQRIDFNESNACAGPSRYGISATLNVCYRPQFAPSNEFVNQSSQYTLSDPDTARSLFGTTTFADSACRTAVRGPTFVLAQCTGNLDIVIAGDLIFCLYPHSTNANGAGCTGYGECQGISHGDCIDTTDPDPDAASPVASSVTYFWNATPRTAAGPSGTAFGLTVLLALALAAVHTSNANAQS